MRKREYLSSILPENILKHIKSSIEAQALLFSYLIVPFWYASAAYQASLDRILAIRSLAKLPLARPNEHDMLPKRTKKVRLGIYHTQIRPKTGRYFFISYRDHFRRTRCANE